ncbi:AcrR family transcriptional regulator [Rhodococcus sp. LBL1]|jgi:AcrR family transcriptional regulator|nr:AcrR family transcriptional regulator [Rhodococcus sp. LBL1]MDH6682135.1 AcrR family transcriptional regulator [Rhodococcus sp. LBL2]
MASTDLAERSGKLSRSRILEIATEHFAAYGYRGASLGKIAAAAGLSQPGLLHHFPNKAALLEAVLIDRDRRDLEAAIASGEELESLNLEELIEFMARIVARNSDHRNLVQLAHHTAVEVATGADHPAHGWVVGRQRILHELCESAVRRSIDRGSIRSDADPRQISVLLVAASEGIENQWLLDPTIDMAATFQHFANLMYESVSARAE